MIDCVLPNAKSSKCAVVVCFGEVAGDSGSSKAKTSKYPRITPKTAESGKTSSHNSASGLRPPKESAERGQPEPEAVSQRCGDCEDESAGEEVRVSEEAIGLTPEAVEIVQGVGAVEAKESGDCVPARAEIGGVDADDVTASASGKP